MEGARRDLARRSMRCGAQQLAPPTPSRGATAGAPQTCKGQPKLKAEI